MTAVPRFCALAICLVACSDAAGAEPSVDASVRDAAVRDAGALSACVGGGTPGEIADVLTRIDALPEPSIACLMASLPRPLSLVASLGVTSLQPAANSNAPRIFVMLDKLVLSVVAEGDGADRVEFGQWVTPLRTLKGELRFPVTLPVPAEAPYLGLVDVGQRVSSCGFCHNTEEAHPSIPGAFVSDALQPAQLNELSIVDLRAIHAQCKLVDGPHCWLLRALFDYGEVRQGAFAREVRRGF